MDFIRKAGKVIAGLWLVAVIVIGLGGTWLTHNPDALFPGSIDDEIERAQAHEDRSLTRSEARREARDMAEAGWGDTGAMESRRGSDWGD